MRVAVTGASGNVGTSVLRALSADDAISGIVAIARRRPEVSFDRTRWVSADVSRDDLVPVFRGADAVVHLAWLIQPSRDAPRRRGGDRPAATGWRRDTAGARVPHRDRRPVVIAGGRRHRAGRPAPAGGRR